MFRTLTAVLTGLALLAAPASAATIAAPVVDAAGAGNALRVAGTGDVVVTFTGRHGIFDKKLYLVREGQEDLFLFDGRQDEAGAQVNLGALEQGSELLFRLAVTTHTGQQFDLFTGAASLNPRNFANARAMTMGTALAMVSFEDLIGGGDLSFNDFGFNVEGAVAGDILANPVPGAAVLMVTALGGAAAWRQKRA